MIKDKGNLVAKAHKILQALGGIDNIEDEKIDNCATRLRIQLKDINLVDEVLLRRQGAVGFIHLPENQIQVVFNNVHKLANELRKQVAMIGLGL